MNTTTEEKTKQKRIRKPIDDKGTFKWLPKEELLIDHDYQRDKINKNRISEMAADWQWRLCGVVCVALREKGHYIIDGQHRKLAADLRSDITTMPCIIFTTDNKCEEASSFVDLNGRRTTVTGPDRFKAMLAALDKSAIELKGILEATGHRVANYSSTKTVSCIICLWNQFKKHPDTVRRLWPLISDMNPGNPVTDVLVNAMVGCETYLEPMKLSLTHEPARSKMLAIGGMPIVQEIRRNILLVGHGGQRVATISAMKLLNKQKLGFKFKVD